MTLKSRRTGKFRRFDSRALLYLDRASERRVVDRSTTRKVVCVKKAKEKSIARRHKKTASRCLLCRFSHALHEPSIRANDASTTATTAERVSLALFTFLFRIDVWPRGVET